MRLQQRDVGGAKLAVSLLPPSLPLRLPFRLPSFRLAPSFPSLRPVAATTGLPRSQILVSALRRTEAPHILIVDGAPHPPTTPAACGTSRRRTTGTSTDRDGPRPLEPTSTPAPKPPQSSSHVPTRTPYTIHRTSAPSIHTETGHAGPRREHTYMHTYVPQSDACIDPRTHACS